MKFLIPLFIFFSLNATSQLTICTLESKPSWSQEPVIYAFCIDPKAYLEWNDWFVWHSDFLKGHLFDAPALLKNTTRAMEIDGGMVDVYQGSGVFNKVAYAFHFPNQDKCNITFLKCENCEDDFELQDIFFGPEPQTATQLKNVVYYSDPKVDFSIEATGTSYSNKIESYGLKRNVFSNKLVVWEYTGHREGKSNNPWIEFENKSDKEADYYFITDGDAVRLVKINKKGKDVSLYLFGSWESWTQNHFWKEPSVLTKSWMTSSDKLILKK